MTDPAVSENGSCSDHEEQLEELVSREVDEKNRVPLKDYLLVGFDVDTTGRRLLDEVVHIAAYTPDDQFSMFAMPHGDFTPEASNRHALMVHTNRIVRTLRDRRTGRGLKTKNEVSVMSDFLEWLEKLCEKHGKAGVLLISHERFKFNPYIFIKSLQEYNLMDRFEKIVKGFVDCHEFAKKKCEKTMVSFSLRVLARVLLDKDNVEIYQANERAALAYEIVQHLSAGASEIGEGAISPNEEIVKCILPFTSSVEMELDALEKMRTMINRQNTLKPIFRYFMRFSISPFKRRNALKLRRYLVDSLVDYEMLSSCWTDKGKTGIEELLKEKIKDIPDKDFEELLKLLTEHFENPEEIPAAARVPNRYPRNGRRGYGRGGRYEYRNNYNNQQNADARKTVPQDPVAKVEIAVN